MTSLVYLTAGNGVGNLITTGEKLLQTAQSLGLIAAGISFAVGGFYLMLGGDRGRPKAIGWFVGAGVGLVVVMSAYGFAQMINSNISF